MLVWERFYQWGVVSDAFAIDKLFSNYFNLLFPGLIWWKVSWKGVIVSFWTVKPRRVDHQRSHNGAMDSLKTTLLGFAIATISKLWTYMWEFLWISWSTIIKPNIQGLPCQLMRWIVWGRFLEAGMKAWWDKVRKAPLTQSFTSPFSVQTAQAVKRSSDLLHKKRRWITS